MTQRSIVDSRSELESVRMAIAAFRDANRRLGEGNQKIQAHATSVPHTLFYGPAGVGKTTRALECARLMGCSAETKNFAHINADTIKNIEDFIRILQSVTSFDGYRCTHGKVYHSLCVQGSQHRVDLTAPVAPVKPSAVFIDEIHLLSKDLQEKLGQILLDFAYPIMENGKLRTIQFPKFACFAATTIPGDLIKPLRSRFGIKVPIAYYSDEEMFQIVEKMADDRDMVLEETGTKIIARIAQGVAREAENHLKGAYNCLIYMKELGQISDQNGNLINNDVVRNYIKTRQFLEDGLSLSQIRVLYCLKKNADNSTGGLGLVRLCSTIGADEQQYLDELEPRLFQRGLIMSGGRGRTITPEGAKYLERVLKSNKEIRNQLIG